MNKRQTGRQPQWAWAERQPGGDKLMILLAPKCECHPRDDCIPLDKVVPCRRDQNKLNLMLLAGPGCPRRERKWLKRGQCLHIPIVHDIEEEVAVVVKVRSGGAPQQGGGSLARSSVGIDHDDSVASRPGRIDPVLSHHS